jgi:nucleoside diphosphate kinase
MNTLEQLKSVNVNPSLHSEQDSNEAAKDTLRKNFAEKMERLLELVKEHSELKVQLDR